MPGTELRLKGAGPSACVVSASGSCKNCGRLGHLGDQSNSVGKVMRDRAGISEHLEASGNWVPNV